MKSFIIGISFFVLSLGVNHEAFAMKGMMSQGGRIGNGGGLVVCRDKTTRAINEVQLLDFFEARSTGKGTLDLSNLQGTWKERAQSLINRLASLSPLRQNIYTQWLGTFEDEAIFLKDIQFSTISDTGTIGVKKGCEFEQGLVQINPIFPGDKRYNINDELWQAMDDSERAGLVLHELLYREALGYGHDDSIAVRHLNRFIVDQSFKSTSLDQWKTFLTFSKFEMTDVPSSEDLEVTLKLNQIWHQDAYGQMDVFLPLKNALPILLGICGGDGCKTFTPVGELAPFNSLPLHPMANEIAYGKYSVKRFDTIKTRHLFLLSINNRKINWVKVSEITNSTLVFDDERAFQVIGPNLQSIVLEVQFAQNSIMPELSELEFTIYQDTNNQIEENCYFTEATLDEAGNLKTLRIQKDKARLLYSICYLEHPRFLLRTQLAPLNINGFLENTKLAVELNADPKLGPVLFLTNTSFYFTGGLLVSIKNSLVDYSCPQRWGCIEKTAEMAHETLEQIKIINVVDITIAAQGKAIHLNSQVLNLYPNNIPKSVTLAESVALIQADGTSHTFKAGETIYLTEDGKVKN